MVKKEHNEVTFVPEESAAKDVAPEKEEPLYESEAYGTPQPDEGTKTTVTKPVGLGGPVPIIAPKHNTIQLQPIVVPLALVPYMTQDSDVLRTDGTPQRGDRDGGSAVDFTAARTEEEAVFKKKKAGYSRIFSLIIFIVSALMVTGFLLANFKAEFEGMISFAQLNAIGAITAWAQGGAPADLAKAIISVIAAAAFVVVLVLSFSGLVFGKFPRKLIVAFSFVGTAALAAQIIYGVVSAHFTASEQTGLYSMLGVGAACLVLAIVFAVIAVRREDKEEEALLRTYDEI